MSVLIALPCYGGNVNEKTTTGLFRLGKQLMVNNIDHGLLTLSNESLITRGRSRIANFFLNNTSYDYIFFLDSDIGFLPDDFFGLWEHRDKGIVCGAYPMKGLPLRYNFNLKQPLQEDGSLIEITGIGFGFCLIHRSVFTSISRNFPELKYTPNNLSNVPLSKAEMENSYHYFMERKIDETFLPEDHSFFSRAQDSGVKIWMNRSIKLDHTGYYVFSEGGT